MDSTNNCINSGWCSDKTSELALYYNLACDRLNGFVYGEEIKLTDTQALLQKQDSLEFLGLYIKLKNYLWKGFNDDKNSSGTLIDTLEIELIRELLNKLNAIRNFQSHYYHNDDALIFNYRLKTFVEHLYNSAIQASSENYPTATSEYLKKGIKLFDEVRENGVEYLLNYEGKGFFLSFFLVKSEMKHFLQKRRGSKRNDISIYRVKHLIYTHYCHRDGAQRFHYNKREFNMNRILSPELHSKNQFYKLNQYLNNIPQVLNVPEVLNLLLGNKDASITDILTFCNNHNLFSKYKIKVKNDAFVTIAIKSYPHVKVLVDFKTLVHLVDDQLRLGNSNNFDIVFKYYLTERINLIRRISDISLLNHLRIRREQTLISWLLEFEKYKLRNNKIELKTGYSVWLESFINYHNNESVLREKALLSINRAYIILNYTDFFVRLQSKPRQRDKFMRFAVQYLIDMNLCPNVSWQWQSYKVIEKGGKSALSEVTEFSNKTPQDGNENWRLKFTYDNQILISIGKRKNDTTVQPQKFLIGHRLMKNLLIAHFEQNIDWGKTDDVFQIFFGKIYSDFKKLQSDYQKCQTERKEFKIETCEYLDSNSVPTWYGLKKFDIKYHTITRIQFLIKEIETLRTKQKVLSRADKNRQIMRCYRLFDWDKRRSNGVELYLRKNEYKRLSLFHYTLEFKRQSEILEEIKQTNKLPDNILTVLTKAKSLDEVFDKITGESIIYLKAKLNTIEHIGERYIKSFAKKIGVPVYKNERQNDHVPFAIHPILPLKILYPSNPNINLSKTQWNQYNKSSTNLVSEHYIFDNHLKIIDLNNSVKEKKLLIGKINSQITYDMLLYKIAKCYNSKYEKVSNYANRPAILFAKKVGMYDVNIVLQYKQLNDILTSFTKDRLGSLLDYTFLKIESGLLPVTLSGLTKDNVVEIPFTYLKKERHDINQQSLQFINAILAFEKEIISNTELKKLNDYCTQKRFLLFEDILNLAGLKSDSSEELAKIRRKALHADIPDGWLYENMRKNVHLNKYLE